VTLTPEEDKILEELAMLRKIHYEGMSEAQKKELDKSILETEKRYKEAAAQAKDEKLSKEQRELAQKRVDAISKAVPGLVKGVLDATSAFQSGDYLAGSAAILDIVGAAFGLLSLAGPAGAMVGALGGAILSAISMILSFFAPKAPSLKDQINELLAKYSALDKIAQLRAIGYAIQDYRATLEAQFNRLIPVTRELPVDDAQTNTLITTFDRVLSALHHEDTRFNNAAFEHWNVAGWLTTSNNQTNELWPLVLGMWCQAYTDILVANTTLNCLLNPTRMDELLALTKGDPPSKIDPELLKKAQVKIEALDTEVDTLMSQWRRTNGVQLGIVDGLLSITRDSGFYTQVGDNTYMYRARGRAGSLDWGPLKAGAVKSFYINLPAGKLDFIAPEYELYISKGYDVVRHKLDPTKGSIGNGDWVLIRGQKYESQGPRPDPKVFNDCVDVCWQRDNTTARLARVYTAHSQPKPVLSYVNIHTVAPDGKVWRINWQPDGMLTGLKSIRALYVPYAPVAGDPHGDALTSTGPIHDIIYGGYKSHSTIWVSSLNAWKEVPSPWNSYDGIEVSQDFFWVFGKEGMACATHASMLKCQRGQAERPDWIQYQFKASDFQDSGLSEQERDEFANQSQVLSLSSCIDGSLSICLKSGSLNLFSTELTIDLKEKKIKLSALQRKGSEPFQIQKMVIPCWSVYQHLREALVMDKAVSP
jgi:hypothetical protein